MKGKWFKFTTAKHSDFEFFALEYLKRKKTTTLKFVLVYIILIRDYPECDNSKINKAIMDKWSVSALVRIKDASWALMDATEEMSEATDHGAIRPAPIALKKEQEETRHLCGLQGYNPMLGDVCPACR